MLRTTRCPASAGPTSTTEPSAAHSVVTPRNAIGPGCPPERGHGARSARWRGPANAAAVSASRCSRAGPLGGAVDECDASCSSTSKAASSAATTARTARVQQVVRAVKVVNRAPCATQSGCGRRCGSYKPAIARRCSVSGPCTSAAAINGSVGPVPKDGQSLASTQTPQAGLRAWHTRRPWKITR